MYKYTIPNNCPWPNLTNTPTLLPSHTHTYTVYGIPISFDSFTLLDLLSRPVLSRLVLPDFLDPIRIPLLRKTPQKEKRVSALLYFPFHVSESQSFVFSLYPSPSTLFPSGPVLFCLSDCMFESESESQRDVKFNFYPFITFFYLRNEMKGRKKKKRWL